jgi:RIO-like serine/threonine protein kinase
MDIHALYEELSKLSMSIYTPFDYILDGKKDFYSDVYDTKITENSSLKQTTREQSLQKLMKINLLKRLESSVHAFRLTLQKFIKKNSWTIEQIDKFDTDGSDFQPE